MPTNHLNIDMIVSDNTKPIPCKGMVKNDVIMVSTKPL